MDEPQQTAAAQKAEDHEAQAESAAGEHGRVDRGFHLSVFLRPEQLGHHHRAADVAAKGKGQKNQRNLIAVSHRRQSVLPDEFARHPAVRQIIQLLEQDAAQQRQAEFPQHRMGLSHCQIFVHAIPLL